MKSKIRQIEAGDYSAARGGLMVVTEDLPENGWLNGAYSDIPNLQNNELVHYKGFFYNVYPS